MHVATKRKGQLFLKNDDTDLLEGVVEEVRDVLPIGGGGVCGWHEADALEVSRRVHGQGHCVADSLVKT